MLKAFEEKLLDFQATCVGSNIWNVLEQKKKVDKQRGQIINMYEKKISEIEVIRKNNKILIKDLNRTLAESRRLGKKLTKIERKKGVN